MKVIKFKLGASYSAKYGDDQVEATVVEIRETLRSKDVVFEVGYREIRVEDIGIEYIPSTCEYAESAEIDDYFYCFAEGEESR